MLYGFTALARELNERLKLSPPIKAQHIDMWNKRRTRNYAGQMFPSPAQTTAKSNPRGRDTRYRWELAPVIDWMMDGVPGPRGHGWKFPGRGE
jgi:hypothetical protein